MYGEAVFAANKTDAATNGLRFKPLYAEVRAIADKPPALSETQEDGAVATNLGDDLGEEAQAGGWGQGTPVVQEGGVKRSPYSVTKRTIGGIGLLAAQPARGATRNGPRVPHKEAAKAPRQDKPRTQQGPRERRQRPAPPRRAARCRRSSPRPALA